MTNQDLENIRAVAPEWAGWLNYSPDGAAFWQSHLGRWPLFWEVWVNGFVAAKDIAIDLKTGAIHVQHAGKIVVVSLAEWSAEE